MRLVYTRCCGHQNCGIPPRITLVVHHWLPVSTHLNRLFPIRDSRFVKRNPAIEFLIQREEEYIEIENWMRKFGTPSVNSLAGQLFGPASEPPPRDAP